MLTSKSTIAKVRAIHNAYKILEIFKKLIKKEDISRRVNSFIQVELQMAKIINETDKHYVNFYFFICKGSCQRKKFVAYWRGCGVYLCTKAKIFN